MSTQPEARPRVLCVDDEPNLLEALERNLWEQFDLVTATSGALGLTYLREQDPFAVIVSDMRMPEMDGAAFLKQARALSPNSARVLLTGQTDLQSAISAVNEGNIFRFLCKPCSKETLTVALQAAANQYRLVTVERDLLERTLGGAVKMMTEVLSLCLPTAFQHASRIRAYVTHGALKLAPELRWEFELAAMFSPLGCITIAPETLDKIWAGMPITPDEREAFNTHPETGHKLLSGIPRLERVAEIVRRQQLRTPSGDPSVDLGASLLRLGMALDRAVSTGSSASALLRDPQFRLGYDERLLSALSDYHTSEPEMEVRLLKLSELRIGMVLDRDVTGKNGSMLVRSGSEVTVALIEQLRRFATARGIVEPLRAKVIKV